MPSITVLAAEHGWARQTCAKALHVLEAEGLVLRVKGIGYFANGPIGMPAGCAHQPATPRGDDLLQSRDDE
jgi:DNA-binding GntR family transcriptional regulator